MKIIEFLNRIEKRPGMYINSIDNLKHIELMLYGYGAAADLNKCDDIITFNYEFNEYLFNKHQISCSNGWATAILENIENVCPLRFFFEQANEFFEVNYLKKDAINISRQRYEI